MRWRQFFTPVQSFDTTQARRYLQTHAPETLTVLDVRQPREYQTGHIPGAKLIPLTDLSDRLHELDPTKPTIVYCAVGGRSRVAAQMLGGKGFEEIYNLTGGIKAWNGEAAFGPPEQGLVLFQTMLSPKESLLVAYSMEQGLQDFYLSVMEKAEHDDVRALFRKLADIETNHQRRIFEEYRRLEDPGASLEAFEANILPEVIEGGLTTEEFLTRYNPDLTNRIDAVSMAMSIEAQALDLYQRAALTASNSETKTQLLKIADEERVHLNELGKLMEML
jgi:sulfur-carrier protein adenylyltransferase/sulfurtransferase